MTKTEITSAILEIFNDQFEIEAPGLDDDLREVYEFDSIDAIELLREIEILLNSQLTREEKKAAMDIRTINHIVDYVDELQLQRATG
jgi:acyl carrier protein